MGEVAGEEEREVSGEDIFSSYWGSDWGSYWECLG